MQAKKCLQKLLLYINPISIGGIFRSERFFGMKKWSEEAVIVTAQQQPQPQQQNNHNCSWVETN